MTDAQIAQHNLAAATHGHRSYRATPRPIVPFAPAQPKLAPVYRTKADRQRAIVLYLTEYGKQPVQVLSDRLGMPRQTCDYILRPLIEAGTVTRRYEMNRAPGSRNNARSVVYAMAE